MNGKKWQFIKEREKNHNELNIILTKKIEEWTFLHTQMKFSVRIHADILK